MVFRNIEDIQTAWEAAEAMRSRGDFIGAYDSYCEILSTLVAQGLPPWCHDIAAQIIQAVAHLSSSIGNFETVDDLFQTLVKYYQLTGNYPFANFTLIKRIELELDRANFGQVEELFQSITPQLGIKNIGDIDISRSGLIQWEINCLWQNADVSTRSVLFAHLYLVMGRTLLATGQYHNALTILERGLWHTSSETPALAQQVALFFHFNIASAYLEQGELDKAVAKLADPNTTDFDPDFDPEFRIRWLEMIAKICLLRGELGQALDRLNQVREICQQLGLAGAFGRSILNLAEFLISINQTNRAKNYLNEASFKELTKRDPELKNRGELLIKLANARSESLVSDIDGGSSISKMRSTTTDTATEVASNQLEDINFSFRSSNYLVQFEFRALQFSCLLSCDKLELANRVLSNIQAAFESLSDSQLIKIKVKILTGTLVYYQGVKNRQPERYKYAASILDELRPNLERMGLKQDLWQVQRILGWCWSRLKIERNLHAELIESNNNLLTEFTKSLNFEDGSIYLLNKWTIEEEYIGGKIQQIRQSPITNSISWKSWRRLPSIQLKYWQEWQLMQKLDELILDIDRYKGDLARQNLEDNRPINKSSIYSAWKRIFTHPRDRITLIFLVLPDQILIVRVGWLLFDYQICSTTRITLRNLVGGWHNEIGKIQGRSRDLIGLGDVDNLDLEQKQIAENREISTEISKLLKIDSLLKDLPARIKSISIVPDDILHAFPFAIIEHENRYLIEKYAVSIRYESQYKDRAKLSRSRVNSSLLVGITTGSPPLENVEPEMEKVKEWMEGHHLNPSVLMDKEWTEKQYLKPSVLIASGIADKETVIDQLSEATFFHIACHGFFNQEQPALSELILSDDKYQPDKNLTLKDFRDLKLKLRHATLSSCWSADQFIVPGRWIVSLPETLCRYGTESVLGCLWEVNDNVALSFTTQFYKYMEKYPRDKALQLTQQDCLNKTLRQIEKGFEGDLSNPLNWSGFTLYGDYKKLDL
jgi:CHAT domain-containing protein